ncbi:MAG: hypothetical protein AAF921_26515 [Cyanobacteria bacterium P01_D01_bin.44]
MKGANIEDQPYLGLDFDPDGKLGAGFIDWLGIDWLGADHVFLSIHQVAVAVLG